MRPVGLVRLLTGSVFMIGRILDFLELHDMLLLPERLFLHDERKGSAPVFLEDDFGKFRQAFKAAVHADGGPAAAADGRGHRGRSGDDVAGGKQSGTELSWKSSTTI